MSITFIGVDLAWKSDRNPTGIAVMEGDRSGARLNLVATLEAESSALEFIQHYATEHTIGAIVSLIKPTKSVNVCETEVGGVTEKRCFITRQT